MANRGGTSGSTILALLIAIFLIVLTVVTCYYFIDRTWWFPEPINAIGREIDAQFMRTLWITGIVFVVSQLALAWIVFRYRGRGGRATYSHGNNTMEILWTTATALLFVGLGFYGRSAWAEMYFRPPAADAIRIEVTGQQFAWNFRYPGPDGKFGATKAELMSDSGGNPLGLDPSDPAGKDDIVVPVFAVPANREIHLLLRAKDVTHSFFIRELRLKQDTVPGMEISTHFTAEKPGRYEIACAELCGLGHQRMRSFMTVFATQAEYEQWLKEQVVTEE